MHGHWRGGFAGLGRADPGKKDAEHRPALGPVLGKDIASRLLDNAINGREAQPGAFAHGLGRKEGIKDLLQKGGFDARPLVGHANLHIIARPDFDAPDRLPLVQAQLSSRDRNRAAVRHRVACVHHQIHQRLFQLLVIRPHMAQLAPVLHDQGNLLADQPVEQIASIRNHVLDQ